MKVLTIWKQSYNPFRIGGNVNAPLGASVIVKRTSNLGRGYHGYVVKGPRGKTVVAEATTGAIIGSTLKQVREDIKLAKASVMEEQMETAKRMMSKVEKVSETTFWKSFRNS